MTTIKDLEDRIKKLEDREHMNILAKLNPQKGDILIIKVSGKPISEMKQLKEYLMSYGIDIPIIYVQKDNIKTVHPSKIILEGQE